MQLTLANLMFLPLTLIVAPMVNITAMYLGRVASRFIVSVDYYAPRWLINLGVPADFATGHLTFFMTQLPTIVVLLLFGAGLFLLRHRHSDQIAVVSLLALPLVDAYLVSCMTVETRSLLHEQSSTLVERIQFAWEYLRTQLLTAIVLMLVTAIYVWGRRRSGYAVSNRNHSAIVYGSLGVLIVGCWAVWLQFAAGSS